MSEESTEDDHLHIMETGQILTFKKVEKILTDQNRENVPIFAPSQLLIMLKYISHRSIKLTTACSVLASRFQEEMTCIKIRSANNGEKLTSEDSTELGLWMKHIQSFLEDTYPTSKKYLLVGLFLEIILAARPFVSSAELDPLAQYICADLAGRPADFANLCKDWSECLAKFSQIDDNIHTVLLCRFKTYLTTTITPEGCFDVYLNNANNAYSYKISEMLFERAITLFQAKKETKYFGVVNFGKYLVGVENNITIECVLFSNSIAFVDVIIRWTFLSLID
jgi:hypothetical protein